MAEFKFMNYVVIDNGTSLNSLRVRRNLYRYTEQGMLLYPIGGVVPIIVKGKGCIGFAVIKKLEMEETITTVQFDYTEIDPQSAKAYYSLYRNNATLTAGKSTDIYSDTDAVIPGAIGSPSVNLAEELPKKSNVSVNDILGHVTGRYDYDDDDDD